jgi:ribosomal protein S18 acetylase RimI-like enzyme
VPVEILEKTPGAQDYNLLRTLVGWHVCDPGTVERSLPGSWYFLCAEVDGKTVGMARIVGDGGIIFYIQDVIVHPDYQRQGIGTKLMDRIMDRIREKAVQNTVVGLMASKGREPFYKRYGFTVRPNDFLGSGMTLLWKNSQLL